MKKMVITSVILVLLLTLLVGCSSTGSNSTAPNNSSSATTAPTSSSSGSSTTTQDGKTLLESRCTVCHSINKVTNNKGTADEWKRVVDDMIKRGAVLSADEKTVLLQYLAEKYK
jgi:cytochrome c5